MQVGHGRQELAEAAAKQAGELAFFPIWTFAHPNAIALAERLSTYTPGDLNRVFFTTGGGEAVETAWKAAKQYFKLTGKPDQDQGHQPADRLPRHTPWCAVDHRHPGPEGGVRAAGAVHRARPQHELLPCVRAHRRRGDQLVRRRSRRRWWASGRGDLRDPDLGNDLEAFGRWAADQIEEAIITEGPDTVAAVFLEPVQNAGGCFPPPPGYFQRVREICDRHDVLLVSDEVICAFGRLGEMFGSTRYGYVPDMITCAKGMTSGYSPLAAMIASDRVMEPFLQGSTSFAHGYTFGGHPVSTAVAMANLDIMEREKLNENVRENEGAFRGTLEKLLDLDIVGDVRGDGFFYGIELVKDKATKETFNDAESEKLLRGFLSKALFDNGLYCRADDRGDPVIQLSPPIIAEQSHFDEMEQILRSVLTEAQSLL